ncbi:MAG: hypothetical protein EHM35_00305 [Planctomycetaceae bacterium]|nr:MAG: hypothetical protein EHM35_00305 [Planctomycetaceae bacterium]
MSDEWGGNAMAEAAALALRRAQAAERRAERLEGLLHALVEDDDAVYYDYEAHGWSCAYCDAWQDIAHQAIQFEHEANCPVLLARAELASAESSETAHGEGER